MDYAIGSERFWGIGGVGSDSNDDPCQENDPAFSADRTVWIYDLPLWCLLRRTN